MTRLFADLTVLVCSKLRKPAGFKTVVSMFIAATHLTSCHKVDAKSHSTAAGTELTYRGITVDGSALEIAAPSPWRTAASLKSGALVALVPRIDGQYISTANIDMAHRQTFGSMASSPASKLTNSLPNQLKMDPLGKFLYFKMDENNNEHFNIYRFDFSTQEMSKLTDSSYVSGYSVSPAGDQIIYSSRRDVAEGSIVDLRLLNLSTSEDKILFTDEHSEIKFPWGNFSWDQANNAVFIVGQYGNDRQKGTVVRLSLNGNSTIEDLLPRSSLRLFPSLDLSETHTSGDDLYFISPENGSQNLMKVSLRSKVVTNIYSSLGASVSQFTVYKNSNDVMVNDRQVLVSIQSILGTTLTDVRVSDGVVSSHTLTQIPGIANILSADSQNVLVSLSNESVKTSIQSFNINSGATVEVLGSEQSALDQAVHCDSRIVRYDTFDDISYDLNGEHLVGKIHAILYTPKVVRTNLPKIAIVQSFYGGARNFDSRIQSLCAIGVTVMSPSVRGVSNVSSYFETLNDGDLGGKEMIDGQYAAKWLVTELGFDPRKIGTWGQSHGGYAAMRQMTFPATFHDLQREFQWAFGISEAGFSSIVGEHDQSNIKAWILKEAGGTRENPDSVADWENRSPINHLDELKSPLLMVHGTSDARVPFSLSQQLFDKATALGLGSLVTLTPIPGAGHLNFTGANFILANQSIYTFLQSVFPE